MQFSLLYSVANSSIHYKGIIISEPQFKGKGNHSVKELETICEQFKEYIHQQQMIKQGCMQHIVELKFGITL